MRTKLVLLDRDGVLNEDSIAYIKTPKELIFRSKSVDAVARLTAAGFKVGVATNQSGVSRGLYSPATLAAIHAKLCAHIQAAGGIIDCIRYCTHLPEAACDCRKPKPRLLLELMQSLQPYSNQPYFVGDRISDIEAAHAAGIQPIIVRSAMTDTTRLLDYPQVPQFASLWDACDYIIGSQP